MANEYTDTKAFTLPMAIGTLLVSGSLVTMLSVVVLRCSEQAYHNDEIIQCRTELSDSRESYASMREGRAVVVNMAYNMAGIAHREMSENPELKNLFSHIPEMQKILLEIQTNMYRSTGLPITDIPEVHE